MVDILNRSRKNTNLEEKNTDVKKKKKRKRNCIQNFCSTAAEKNNKIYIYLLPLPSVQPKKNLHPKSFTRPKVAHTHSMLL